MRKFAFLSALVLAGSLGLPAHASHPDSSGVIKTNLIRQETHCMNAAQGTWGLNEYCFAIPSGVNKATVRFPGMPADVNRGCMVHGSWLMVFIYRDRIILDPVVLDQPVTVTWTDGTGPVKCALG